MAFIPEGVVTIQSSKYNEFMFTSDAKLDKDRRHVCTWASSDTPLEPQEAARWNLVRCGEAFRIQNMMTKEWMYANVPKYNDDRRRVLTFARHGADPPHEDLSYQWHLVPFGASFGIKNVKHDEWLYANGPRLSDQCRHVLAWVPGGNDPKADATASWLIQPAIPCYGTGVKHERNGIVVRIGSSGFDNGNTAEFHLNGVRLAFKASRGLNVAILDPARLQVLSTRTYDIYASYGERNQLAADLSSLPRGHIVLAALKDSGMEKLKPAECLVLRSLGATFSNGKFREGYALIGIKGENAVAEAQGNAVTVTGTIYSANESSQMVTLKVKYNGVFHRVHVPRQVAFSDFEETVCNAIGRDSLAGMRAVYIDEEGDRCIINAGSLAGIYSSAGHLKVDLELLPTSPTHWQHGEKAWENSSTGSFEQVSVVERNSEVD